MADLNSDLMGKLVSLCKRRGFVFAGSEIYGGLANTWDYGPLGVEVLNNIKREWWKMFVQEREDILGLDPAILMNAKVWEASGHTTGFNDALVDCRDCKLRHRADHLIENQLNLKTEGKSLEEMTRVIQENKVKCPNCQSINLSEVRRFNLLFKTHAGAVEDDTTLIYLRGEIAQGMFVNFKNILQTFAPKLPFGIAAMGKAFRNEITPGNFVFRTREFDLMEFEYFIREQEWEEQFEYWLKEQEKWLQRIGVNLKNTKHREHPKESLAHYSKRTVDIEYNYPFGWGELYGLAYRTDFDLRNHSEKSGVDLRYFDEASGEKFFPHVVEPTFGITRTFLVAMLNAFCEEEVKGAKRVVLRLSPKIAPIKVAILPLVRTDEYLVKMARQIFFDLKKEWLVVYDEVDSIGRRYRRQDEIGTPFCVTVDGQSLKDQTVTVRDRDTMKQERVGITELKSFFEEKIIC